MRIRILHSGFCILHFIVSLQHDLEASRREERRSLHDRLVSLANRGHSLLNELHMTAASLALRRIRSVRTAGEPELEGARWPDGACAIDALQSCSREGFDDLDLRVGVGAVTTEDVVV